jgi:pimeloyl-ACP methyl ester carboxylesterase
MNQYSPELAYTWVRGQEPLLVFIHGLGADGRCFHHALNAPVLQGRALLIPDLVGIGNSPHWEDFSYTMEAQAELLLHLCKRLGASEVAIVGHSMGGAIGICLAEMWPGSVTHFANAVGNLIPEDCFYSRTVRDMGWEAFKKGGFRKFKQRIKAESHHARPSVSAYLASLNRTTARAMYLSSCDLVRLSDEGNLLSRFLHLSCKKLYLQDSDTDLPAHLTEALLTAGVPIVRIPDTGHGLMEDNPSVFYSSLAEFLSQK